MRGVFVVAAILTALVGVLTGLSESDAGWIAFGVLGAILWTGLAVALMLLRDIAVAVSRTARAATKSANDPG
jgi:hypothetical protein